MKILRGEIISGNHIIQAVQMSYDGGVGFFVALVAICDRLEIEVPIWSSLEDYHLAHNGEVHLTLENNSVLRISTLIS